MAEKSAEPNPVYLVSFRAEGPGAPPIIRLRIMLKAALRRYGLRAVELGLAKDGKRAEDGPK